MALSTPHKIAGYAHLYLAIAVIVFTATVLSNIAYASSKRLAGLDEIHQHAKYIFYGKCLENRVEQEQQTGFIVTYSTFQILDSIKGKLKYQYTLKQIGGSLASGASYHVEGVPHFKVNEEYVLFLPKKSKLGFSSPVALSQGQFHVLKTKDEKKVSNGKQFSKLLKNIPDKKLTAKGLKKKKKKSKSPKDKKKNSHMALGDFKNLLDKLAGSKDSDKEDKEEYKHD